MKQIQPTPHDQPWTWQQFTAAMRKAGWRLNSQIGLYTHKETGAVWHPYQWTQWRQEKYGSGEAWYQFAIEQTTPTPAPF